MKEVVLTIIDSFNDFLTDDYFQSILVVAQAIFIALVIIFLVLIIILRVKAGYFTDFKRNLSWFFLKGEGTPSNEWVKAWAKIKKALDKAPKNEYHLVLFRAEEFLDMTLEQLGFWGNTLEERLDSAGPYYIRNISEVRRAHSLVNAVREGEPLTLFYSDTEQILFIYEEALRELGVL